MIKNKILKCLRIILFWAILPFASNFVQNNSSMGAEGFSIISDVEMDLFLREIIEPIFDVAKLEKDNLNIYIISDGSVNAFVYYNSIFVNTGLMAFAENTDTLFGVLSHEVGHVVRKHLSRMILNAEEITKNSTGLTLAGLALLIGLSPVASSIILSGAMFAPMVGLNAIMQNKLKYSRQNEGEADQSAIIYLTALKKPLSGLYDTMAFFDSKSSQNLEFYKYLLRHPLPRERLEVIKTAQEQMEYTPDPTDCKIEKKFRRIKGKILGYMDDGSYDSFDSVNKANPCFSQEDLSFFQNYQKIHKLWKDLKFTEAVKLCDEMIAKNPDDAFLIETKANILFSSGNFEKGIELYRKFMTMIKPTKTSKFQFGNMLSSSEKKEDIDECISIYRHLTFADESNPQNYFALSRVYKKLGMINEWNFFLAEGYSRSNQPMQALIHAKKALKGLSSLKTNLNNDNDQNKKMINISQDIIDCSQPKKRKKR